MCVRVCALTAEGIARVYYHGVFHQHKALVMELLGPSLEALFVRCRRFTIKTIAMIAIQLVSNQSDCLSLYRRHICSQKIGLEALSVRDNYNLKSHKYVCITT